jgi:hypothetical protein
VFDPAPEEEALLLEPPLAAAPLPAAPPPAPPPAARAGVENAKSAAISNEVCFGVIVISCWVRRAISELAFSSSPSQTAPIAEVNPAARPASSRMEQRKEAGH